MVNKVNKTYPGIYPNAKMDCLSDKEQRIIKNISRKYWYVTRVERQAFTKNATFKVAFLKPVDYITQNFNLNREVVLILSQYESFEARALDVLDNLDAQLLRLEEICCMVASNDDNIEVVINELLKSNNESRIIVPFTYSELLNEADEELVINKMRKHFFSRDLFGIQIALKKDIYFFGRRDLIQELVNKHENGENAGIFGLRKTGKTSILYGIMRTLNRKNSLPIFIDCQILHNQPWNLALRYIVQKIIADGQLKQSIIEKSLGSYENENEAAFVFEEDMARIMQVHLKKNLLLIFDEVENITFDTSISASWKSGVSFVKFWQVVRSYSQNQRTKWQFTFLIAGTNPRCIEIPSIHKTDNPIFSLFTPHYIEPFNFEQTSEMLNRLGGYMGIQFTPEVIAHVQEDFGGHPLLIRQMCSYIHRSIPTTRPVEIRTQDYLVYKKRFYDDQSGFTQYAQMILQVLSDWYPDEYQMLVWLAIEDEDNFNECAQDSSFIQHLKSYHIIEENGTQAGYHFKIEALQNFLVNKNKFQRPLTSAEDREKEIMIRRSNIEKKLRKLLKRQLKSSIGEEKAKEEMIRAIYGAKEIGHKSNIPYSDFFDSSKHELYLKTLFDVIDRNYGLFENLFEANKETFDSKWRLLNQYRRTDAHAVHISDSDFTTFRGIAQWFETKLSEE